jgi:hypothetical protein
LTGHSERAFRKGVQTGHSDRACPVSTAFKIADGIEMGIIDPCSDAINRVYTAPGSATKPKSDTKSESRTIGSILGLKKSKNKMKIQTAYK